MNKSELSSIIAEQCGFTKVQASAAIDAFANAIRNSLIEEENVVLIGFGTFQTISRAARVGRNPRTGEVIQIAASKIAKFKPGKALKDALLDNGSKATKSVKAAAVTKPVANKTQEKKKKK